MDNFNEIKGVQGVFIRGTEIVITGCPDEDDENHNCDDMGCGSGDHILFRGCLVPPQIPGLPIYPYLVAETPAAGLRSAALYPDKPVDIKPAVGVFHAYRGGNTFGGELDKHFDVDTFHLITKDSITNILAGSKEDGE